MMGESKYKLSASFIVFLATLALIFICVVAFSIYKIGGDWKQFLLGSFLGIVWFAIFIPTVMRAQNGNLSDEEKTYVVDMENLEAARIVKKYLFSDMDIKKLLEFLVVMWTGLCWILFVVFLVCVMLSMFVPKIDRVETLALLGLAVLWFPPLERFLLKRVNHKIIFFTKLIMTASIFIVMIKIGE